MTMRFSVDGWDPSYGSSVDMETLAETIADVDTALEVSTAEWHPVKPDSAVTVPNTVLFVDGVQRIDARAWINDVDAPNGEGHPAVPGLCASFAAGVVRTSTGRAEVIACEVRRGLFSDANTATSIETSCGPYTLHRTKLKADSPPAASLANGLQRALSDLEVTVAVAARHQSSSSSSVDDLLVVDGPLRGKAHLSRTLGYVKSHGVQYLPPEQNAVVADLAFNERTPVFFVASGWHRYSWYLRLPCLASSPWAGIVRFEAASDVDLNHVITTANMTQKLFARFASVEYKDGRAPQNLVPISGLEKQLRHQLGQTALLYRELRTAALTTSGA